MKLPSYLSLVTKWNESELADLRKFYALSLVSKTAPLNVKSSLFLVRKVARVMIILMRLFPQYATKLKYLLQCPVTHLKGVKETLLMRPCD